MSAISVKAQVGAPLAAVGARWTRPTDTQVAWHWISRLKRRCRLIDGALASTYTPVAADVGTQPVAWLTLTADRDRDGAVTAPGATVAPPPRPAPPPAACGSRSSP